MIVNRNENTAELIGLTFGDGGLTYRPGTNKIRFQLRGHFIEDREHYNDYIIPLFNKEVMFPIFKRPVGIVHNKGKGFYGLSVESTRIETAFNYLGMKTGVKKELLIPRWIKSNKIYLCRFIRGLLDTDGCIYCQKNYGLKYPIIYTEIRLEISGCSKNLIQEVHTSLASLGINSCIKNYVPKNKNHRLSYKVAIAGSQVNKWFKLIGSKNPKHMTKFKIWQKQGHLKPFTTLKQRKEMLKNGDFHIVTLRKYTRGCRSGQTG